MVQLNFHTNKTSPLSPPPIPGVALWHDLPILTKLSESYKLWHGYLTHLPKLTRYTLGEKIDNLFTDCLEILLLASYRPKDKKIELLEQLNAKFDTLKFFIKLLWEIKEIDTNKLTALSIPLTEVGKMIGGWMKLYK